MTFRTDDGDKDKFDESLHYLTPKKFDHTLHYPLEIPVHPEQKYHTKKHLECSSLSFSGNTSYIRCAHDSSLDFTTELTIAMWVKINKHKNYNPLISKRLAGVCNYQLAFGNTGFLSFYNGAGFTDTMKHFSTNTWHHVGMTYTGTTTQLYIDGEPVDSFNVGALTANGQDVLIGSDNSGSSLDGYMSKILIYGRAISPAEFLRLSQNKNISFNQLALDFPVESNYSSKKIIDDESTNSNHGTLYHCHWMCNWVREKYKVI